MSRASVLLRNIATNWLGFAVNAFVTLLLTPFILEQLGAARYGVWILSSSVIGYYGLLDLGFRAGVTQHLTRYLAIGDNARAGECLSTAVAVMGAVAALIGCLAAATAFLAPPAFRLVGGIGRDAFWCILIFGLGAATQMAFMPFSSVFVATQRFDIANLVGIVTRILTAAAVLAALWSGFGLVGVSAATCMVNVADYVVRWRISRRLLPDLSLSPSRVNARSLREIGSFGVWNFLMAVNTYIYQHVPNMLIGAFLPVAAVGQYALAAGLSRQITSFLSPVSQVMYPAAAELHAQHDLRGVSRIYHEGSRLMLLVMFPTALIAVTWGYDFYVLWVGTKYLDDSPFTSVAVLFQILLLSAVTSHVSSIGQQVLIGSGHVRIVALALVAGSIINLTGAMATIHVLGLTGVALSVLIASIVIDLIAVPLIVQRVLGLSIVEFVKAALCRPAISAVLQTIVVVAIHHFAPSGSWVRFGFQVAFAGASCAAVALVVGVTADERRRFVVSPMLALWRSEFGSGRGHLRQG